MTVTRLNTADVVVVLSSLTVGGVIAGLGIVLSPANLAGIAGVIGAVLGPVATLYGFARTAEWKARAADPSTLVEQELGRKENA